MNNKSCRDRTVNKDVGYKDFPPNYLPIPCPRPLALHGKV